MERTGTQPYTAGSLSERNSPLRCLQQTRQLLIRSILVKHRDHSGIEEYEEGDPDTTIVQPEGERGGELEDGSRSLRHVSVIPRRAQHGEVERYHHHAGVEH